MILTSPTVPYKVVDCDGNSQIISNPSLFPDPQEQREKGFTLLEPMVEATMVFPSEYLGDVIELCEVFLLGDALTSGKSRKHARAKSSSGNKGCFEI